LVGKTLGHYEILEPLGKGGTAEVCRAQLRNRLVADEVASKGGTMKSALRSVSLVSLVVLVAACAPAAEQPAPLEEPDTTAADLAAINELREAHDSAFTAGDVDGFIDLFSDDAQALRNGNSVLVGKEAIRSWSGWAIRSWEEEVFDQFDSEMTYFSDEIELMGEVAFNLGTYRLTQTPKAGGDSIAFYGNYILVLRKQADGSWKITRYMWNNRPDPEM